MNSLLLVSNYFNAHQLGLATHLYRLLGNGFHFVSLRKGMDVIGRPSLDMGYGYVLKEYDTCDKKLIRRHIREDDMVVFGDMGAREDLVLIRDFSGKPYLRYTERPFKTANDRTLFNKLKTELRFSGSRRSMSVLCAGAYTVDDLGELGFPDNRCYSWGYFPLLEGLEINPRGSRANCEIAIVWVGRFIDWKRPEWAVRLALDLRKRGVPFHLSMIGDGPLYGDISEMLANESLGSQVCLMGSLPPERVLEELGDADVYIMTSNHQEGWGVSLNEAMYAWCVPVADRSAGAVPFLIEDGINGRSYKADSYEGFLDCVLGYTCDRALVFEHSAKAHATVIGQWGCESAAKSLVELSKALMEGGDIPQYTGGCCQRLDNYSKGQGAFR